jgi:hypothetical protein
MLNQRAAGVPPADPKHKTRNQNYNSREGSLTNQPSTLEIYKETGPPSYDFGATRRNPVLRSLHLR